MPAPEQFNRILIIQTAFIGDVVLGTGVAEKLHEFYPAARIDFLVRKGNEGLLANHPFLNDVLVWDKKESKYRKLLQLIANVRRRNYDLVVNLHRYAASGLLTGLSGGRIKVGFRKNPLSFLFSKSFPHQIGKKGDPIFQHEIERNHRLIEAFTDDKPGLPRLYPTREDYEKVRQFQAKPYLVIAPASVWFTKQFPAHKWENFIEQAREKYTIYLVGGPTDSELCKEIAVKSGRKSVESLAGRLSFLQTAALMDQAIMNYVNDSAPLHFASAMRAPVAAIFCSTIPEFGFGPLGKNARVIELKEELKCRPCGLHGYKQCPLGHFHCAEHIEIAQLLEALPAYRELAEGEI